MIKLKEEYSIADRDELILLDRKAGILKNTRPSMDDFFRWFDQNAPLKLRLLVRQSSNEKHRNFRQASKDKTV